MNKISFIIPAHNAEETIARTIDSIERLNPDSEILIIENGSTDKTKGVSESFSKNYGNIRVLTSEKGVSKARNKGIQEATGQWIVFCDADDECLEDLAEIIDTLGMVNTDLIVGGYKKDNDYIKHDYEIMNKAFGMDDSVKVWMLSRPTLRMQAWAKVYRKEFLIENDLFFNEALSYSEDSEFVIRVLTKAKRVIITDKLFYQYHSGTVSAMRGMVKGRIEAYINALKVAENDVSDETQAVKSAFVDYVIAHINIIGVHDIFGCDIKDRWNNKCKKMRELMKEDVLRRSFEKMNISLNPQALPVMLCKHHLTCMGGVIYYVRSLQNKRRSQRACINNYPGPPG